MNVHPIEFEPRGFYEPGVFHLRVSNCEYLSENTFNFEVRQLGVSNRPRLGSGIRGACGAGC